MEIFFLAGIVAIIAAFMLFAAWKSPLLLLGMYVFTRTVLDGFSDITYKNIVGSLSYMQVYSFVMIIVFSLYILKIKENVQLISKVAFPVGAVIFTYLLSTIVSNDILPAIENTTKWIYMLLIAILVYRISLQYRLRYLMITLFLAVLPALIIQMHSIIVQDFIIASGGHKAYFGGYHHQNMLSYLIVIFIISSLYLSLDYYKTRWKLLYASCTLYGLFALYLCGYRTTILAVLIMLFVTAALYIRLSSAAHKLFIIALAPLLSVLIIYFLGADLQQKLADLGIFLQSPMSYLDFSGRAEHITLFSGRLTILNTLMAAYTTAPIEATIAGLGLEASQKIVGTYPHNEFVASLVECGILGLLAFVFFMGYYFCSILRTLSCLKIQEAVFVGAGAGMFTMTLATMPFRDMRAMLLFGLILGITHFIYGRSLGPASAQCMDPQTAVKTGPELDVSGYTLLPGMQDKIIKEKL